MGANDLFEDKFKTLFGLYFHLVKTKFNRNLHKIENWMTNGLLISRAKKTLSIKPC